MKQYIEKMQISDLESIKQTLLQDFDDFWTVETLKQELENPSSTYLVLKDETEILGFGGIWRSVDDVHVTNIVTRKAKRHCGIASQILGKLISLAKEENFESITLEVNESNLIAISLYEKYGFDRIGFRKKYYNNKENAIVMTRSLN